MTIRAIPLITPQIMQAAVNPAIASFSVGSEVRENIAERFEGFREKGSGIGRYECAKPVQSQGWSDGKREEIPFSGCNACLRHSARKPHTHMANVFDFQTGSGGRVSSRAFGR
jgi:hypothetical protein